MNDQLLSQMARQISKQLPENRFILIIAPGKGPEGPSEMITDIDSMSAFHIMKAYVVEWEGKLRANQN